MHQKILNSLFSAIKAYQPNRPLDASPTLEPFASVMVILLVDENKNIEIPLTKRSAHLPDYPGQFSLPGGMRDAVDHNLYQTACRELLEELNIRENNYEFLGQLDDIFTRDKKLVRPFVVTMQKSQFTTHYKLAIDEIESIYFLDIHKLKLFKEDLKLATITQRAPSYVFSENEIYVWGLTASILVNFCNIIFNDTYP